MKNNDGTYLLIEAVVVTRDATTQNQQLSIEIGKHGQDAKETVRLNNESINEIHWSNFFEPDATVLPSDINLNPLSTEPDLSVQNHDWLRDTSDWIHIRAAMTLPGVGPNYIVTSNQPTVVDMWLADGGAGVYRVSNAISGVVFETGPIAMHRAPIPVLASAPTWMPELLKFLAAAFVFLRRIRPLFGLTAFPWGAFLVWTLIFVGLIILLYMEFIEKSKGPGGLGGRAQQAFDSLEQLRIQAELRKKAIEDAGEVHTPEDIRRVKRMLDEVTRIGNELGGILDPGPDEQEDIDKAQEQLEELNQQLEGGIDNNFDDDN